jgi:hypothetical protein
MPASITLHIALIVMALAILACLGWSALSAVWSWATTGGPVPVSAIIGAVVVALVFILLAAGL